MIYYNYDKAVALNGYCLIYCLKAADNRKEELSMDIAEVILSAILLADDEDETEEFR